jgi:hypothetical protein
LRLLLFGPWTGYKAGCVKTLQLMFLACFGGYVVMYGVLVVAWSDQG